MNTRQSPRPTSLPEPLGYEYKRGFYRDETVASLYDEERFAGPARERRNRRKWSRIVAGLESLGPSVRRVIDLPCGTGRFTPALVARGLDVVGADISLEMMRRADEITPGGLGFVQNDAQHLPFADNALDCVISIRFMFHVDPETRVEILREYGRVAPYQIVDYRHRHSYRYVRWRVSRALGLTDRPLERVSRRQLEGEFSAAGLRIRDVLPIAPFFSDKWVVVAERA